ncbi:MAG: hypothetical protein J6X22_07595 [Muribaculaceae bacterium]|nr:hypothetical protein [Muribaculaceae bacterium]
MKRKITILTCLILSCLICSVFLLRSSNTDIPDGYDLSSHNRNLNWKTLSKSQFVYLKASEGSTFKDKKYNEYKIIARQHNLKVGAYHFMCNDCSGKKQFEHYKSVAKKDIDLIPALDVEISGINKNNIIEFISECEKYYGVKPIIYINYLYMLNYHSAIKGCKIWLSNKTPFTPLCDYVIEQYAIKKIDGVDIDCNRINPKYSIKGILLDKK